MTTSLKPSPTSSEVARNLSRLDAEGAWVVGGAVRDALADGQRSSAAVDIDIDIVTSDAAAWSRSAAERLGTTATRLSAEFDDWRVACPWGQIDVWGLADGDLERDLGRRDFTVNAMAVPLDDFRRGAIGETLIDPFGGLDDLQRRRLRLVSADALQDDPIRLLRAVRLESQGVGRPDAELRSAIRRQAQLIERTARERQWAELQRILTSPSLPWALRRLDCSGLLDVVLPELARSREVDQRPAHRRDVFRHQLDAVSWLVRLTSREPPRSGRAANTWRPLRPLTVAPDVRASLDEWRLPLRLATLLHDIGKPETRTVDARGATHFYGHSELGADLARERLRALRAPGETIDQVCLLIEQHLRPGRVHSPGRPPTDRALYRFHQALGGAATPLCLLFLADSLATVGAEALLPRWPGYISHVARIVQWRPNVPQQSKPLLDGRQIMAVTGLTPGPMVGAIRAKIYEAAALGEVVGAADARALAIQLAAVMTQPESERSAAQ